MAITANAQMAQPHHEYVFDELRAGSKMSCELCKLEPAAYTWSQQRGGVATEQVEMALCRVCAGMILLLGKAPDCST
jgi:hypothetical protein